MPPIGNRGGDVPAVEEPKDDRVDPAPQVDPTPLVTTPSDVPAVEEPKDDRVRLQLVNAFGAGDTFTVGEYTVASTPTLVPPGEVDAILAAAVSAGVQVVNLDQEG